MKISFEGALSPRRKPKPDERLLTPDKIEEVKKILTDFAIENVGYADVEHIIEIPAIAHQICRLFKTSPNEPKPDVRSRVLTDEELNQAWDNAFDIPVNLDHEPTVEEIFILRLRAVARAQNVADKKFYGAKE